MFTVKVQYEPCSLLQKSSICTTYGSQGLLSVIRLWYKKKHFDGKHQVILFPKLVQIHSLKKKSGGKKKGRLWEKKKKKIKKEAVTAGLLKIFSENSLGVGTTRSRARNVLTYTALRHATKRQISYTCLLRIGHLLLGKKKKKK